MRALELLAPARNIDIGIAAIDCGADAVYIAGPRFGARQAAGNGMGEIQYLCEYAHKYGARIFMTVNTIVFEEELKDVHNMMLEAQAIGVDGFIVQDLAITSWDDIKIPIHASTQCAIRTVQKASFLESLGFARLVLERELSLEQIKDIAEHTNCELEAFVHGALCVCYSGQCYLSENICSRSANRGSCIQACRSLYDLVDQDGKVLVKNKALLSLKDYRLLDRMEDMALAGINSFKIEGRLKNISYVKNVVSEYSKELDKIVEAHPEMFYRASFGHSSANFKADSDKTFNRGYTELYIDGKKASWSSMDAPKAMGEHIGTIASLRQKDASSMEVRVKTKGQALHNGDGFSVVTRGGIIGFRGDICQGNTIVCKLIDGISPGDKIYRNLDASFEKILDRERVERDIRAYIDVVIEDGYKLIAKAVTEDGRTATVTTTQTNESTNKERMVEMLKSQLSKKAYHYSFSLRKLNINSTDNSLPFLSASSINSIRRELASILNQSECIARPLVKGKIDEKVNCCDTISYKDNVANNIAAEVLKKRGAKSIEQAYELSHNQRAELMRTKYCIKYELGICPVHQRVSEKRGSNLFLMNNGRRFALEFDCKACEMIVKEA